MRPIILKATTPGPRLPWNNNPPARLRKCADGWETLDGVWVLAATGEKPVRYRLWRDGVELDGYMSKEHGARGLANGGYALSLDGLTVRRWRVDRDVEERTFPTRGEAQDWGVRVCLRGDLDA